MSDMNDMDMMEESKVKNKAKNIDPSLPLISTQSLMEILDFSRAELESNRNGGVTTAQKDKIKGVLQEEIDASQMLVNIFIGVGILLALIFMSQGYGPLALLLGLGVIVGPMLVYSYMRRQNLNQDLERLRPYQIEGVPYIRPNFGRERTAYMQIGEESLPLDIEQAQALSEFALPPMRIHYAANSKQVLSAEVLSDREIDKLKNDDLLTDEEADFVLESARQLDDVSAEQQSTRQS